MFGEFRYGAARYGRRGMLRFCKEWYGKVRYGRSGEVRPVPVGKVTEMFGR